MDALKALLPGSERLVSKRDVTTSAQGDALLNLPAALATPGTEINTPNAAYRQVALHEIRQQVRVAGLPDRTVTFRNYCDDF